jgi:DNA-binding NtrC family response regulator
MPRLVQHFLDQLALRDGREKVLSDAAYDHFTVHSWPGNVRELENEIERLWVLSGDETLIGEEYLSPSILNARAAPNRANLGGETATSAVSTEHKNLPEAVEALERAMITQGLRNARGNKTRAAEELGISRRNLIRKVQSYGLEDAWQSNSENPAKELS